MLLSLFSSVQEQFRSVQAPDALAAALRLADSTCGNALVNQSHNQTRAICAGKVLSRDLTQQLNNAIQFLVHCRPLSISMGNAIKYVKLQASLLFCSAQ